MYDTYITVVGTALHQPEKRRTNTTNALVVTFKVATHPRRYDAKSEQWVDAPSLRIRVNCWRRLAENVLESVTSGDPVVVHGRISTREWKTDNGETRTSYEMDADCVGHDLSRGTAAFTRFRPAGTSVVEDEDTDNRVGGELTLRIDGPMPNDAPHEDRPFDDDFSAELEALAALREEGMDARPVGGDDEEDEEETAGAAADPGGVGGRSRRRARQPVPA